MLSAGPAQDATPSRTGFIRCCLRTRRSGPSSRWAWAAGRHPAGPSSFLKGPSGPAFPSFRRGKRKGPLEAGDPAPAGKPPSPDGRSMNAAARSSLTGGPGGEPMPGNKATGARRYGRRSGCGTGRRMPAGAGEMRAAGRPGLGLAEPAQIEILPLDGLGFSGAAGHQFFRDAHARQQVAGQGTQTIGPHQDIAPCRLGLGSGI